MQVFRGFNHPELAQSCALTIGNFDGVHRGHQAMLALLRSEAQQRGVDAGSSLLPLPSTAELLAMLRALLGF